jgi:hypothetical protein
MIRLAIAIICIFLSACAHQQEPSPPAPVAQNLPEPRGSKVPAPLLLGNKTDVWKEYGCDKKPLPFLTIESQKIIPSSPQRGQKFEHHFVYVACVSDAQTSVKGIL